MKKVIIIWSELNQLGFGLEVEEEDVEKAVELAEEGFRQWNCPSEYPEYHDVGYAEPSMWMLDEAGIKYRLLEDDEMTTPEGEWNPALNIAYTSTYGLFVERRGYDIFNLR